MKATKFIKGKKVEKVEKVEKKKGFVKAKSIAERVAAAAKDPEAGPKEKKLDTRVCPASMAAEMILGQSHTDAEIMEVILKKYPDSKISVSVQRNRILKGDCAKFNEMAKTLKVDPTTIKRLVRNDAGELVSSEQWAAGRKNAVKKEKPKLQLRKVKDMLPKE